MKLTSSRSWRRKPATEIKALRELKLRELVDLHRLLARNWGRWRGHNNFHSASNRHLDCELLALAANVGCRIQ